MGNFMQALWTAGNLFQRLEPRGKNKEERIAEEDRRIERANACHDHVVNGPIVATRHWEV